MKKSYLGFLLDLRYLYRIQQKAIRLNIAVNVPFQNFCIGCKSICVKILKKLIKLKKKLTQKIVFNLDIFLKNNLKVKDLKAIFYDY